MEEKNDNEKTLDYLKDWSGKYKAAREAAPYVDKAIEQKEWEVNAFKSMPESASEIPSDHLHEAWASEWSSWKQLLPPMPSYNTNLIVTGLAITTSGTSTAFEFMTRAAEIEDAQQWAEQQKHEYMQIQGNQNRIEEAKNLLQKLNRVLATEFDEAERAYRVWRLGAGERSGAALLLRNVLEHVKGDLLKKAINRPNEQKPTWEQMASRLVLGGPGSTPYQALITLERDWKSLHRRLTDIGKNLEAGVVSDLEVVFTQVVDHLFSVLSLINPKYL